MLMDGYMPIYGIEPTSHLAKVPNYLGSDLLHIDKVGHVLHRG